LEADCVVSVWRVFVGLGLLSYFNRNERVFNFIYFNSKCLLAWIGLIDRLAPLSAI
jgi:hypothetical protein